MLGKNCNIYTCFSKIVMMFHKIGYFRILRDSILYEFFSDIFSRNLFYKIQVVFMTGWTAGTGGTVIKSFTDFENSFIKEC